MYKIMSSANRDNFTSSFLIWVTLISFSCLIALVKISSTLNRSSESGHCFLASDLGEKTFNFRHEVSCSLVMDGLHYVEICSFCT